MPRLKTSLSASEYAVLGLLRQRPAYGYELQRRLGPGSDLGRVCPVEPAMVYAILKSLAGLELIDGAWDHAQYPPRAVYAVTPEGEDTLRRWLRSPVGRMREVRLDFLIKLYFALAEDTSLAQDLIDAQVDVCRDYEANVEAELAAVGQDAFLAAVLGSKLSAVRATRDWLEQCREQLG